MKTEVCGACKFWQASVPVGRPDDEMGECRRRPPRGFPLPSTNQLSGVATVRAIAVFPPTHATAWCGEFVEGDDGDGEA